MPLLVLYVILVLLTPIPVIYLLVRNSKLREQLGQLEAQADSQMVGLQRQVAELNKRVQSLETTVSQEQRAPSDTRAAASKPESLAHPLLPPLTPPPAAVPRAETQIPTQFIPAPLPLGIPGAAEPPREVV